MPVSAWVVLTTVSNLSEARRISSEILNHKLAACISITSPVESHYVWKGKKEKSRERLLIIKSRKPLFGKLEKLIKKIHSYDCPEILALPVSAGSKPYLEWIKKTVSHKV